MAVERRRTGAAMGSAVRLAIALAAVAGAPAALAEAPSRSVQVALGAGTDFPISVGGRLEIEARSRLRLTTSLGVVPGPYVDVVNDAIVSMGGYDDATADLVERSLDRALVWRTHAGARLWRNLYLEAGYGLAALGGAGTAGELLAATTGQQLPPGAGADRTFDVESTLHMVDVEVGWMFPLGRAWRLRASIGGAFTFAASTRITANYEPVSQALVEAFAREAEAYLDDVYRTYVHLPVVGLSVSRTIF